jgi:hypothetical protein
MRKVEVKDFAEFVNQIEILGLISSPILFRGQPERGNLLPAIARGDPRKNTAKIEKTVLKQLSLMGAALFSTPNMSELDLLVLAQHFGLKTRLLDWTSNPLAALWFACADPNAGGDVYVYALDAHDLQHHDLYAQDPFSQKKTGVFQPRLNNPRIIAQHGWFTLHRYSEKSGKFVALESNSDVKGRLDEFKVAEKNRASMLDSLDRHGITRSTLFPDLEGLCKHLNWKFSL